MMHMSLLLMLHRSGRRRRNRNDRSSNIWPHLGFLNDDRGYHTGRNHDFYLDVTVMVYIRPTLV